MAHTRYSLSAVARTITGKKVRQLRRDGSTPANIYGRNVASMAVTLNTAEFHKVYRQAGETGLIDLQLAEESGARPVLIHDVLENPVNGTILHVDFYQVNLKEKITATVPLEFVGESPVVKNNEGILLELLQEVEVECLPTDLPQAIQVDISGLTELNQGIQVSELPLPSGVDMQTDGEELVCKIETAQMTEEAEETLSTEESVAEGEVENPGTADQS